MAGFDGTGGESGGHLGGRNGWFCHLFAGATGFPDRDPGCGQVARGRFPVDPGLPFDPAQRPSETAQSYNLLLFLFAQDIAHEN